MIFEGRFRAYFQGDAKVSTLTKVVVLEHSNCMYTCFITSSMLILSIFMKNNTRHFPRIWLDHVLTNHSIRQYRCSTFRRTTRIIAWFTVHTFIPPWSWPVA